MYCTRYIVKHRLHVWFRAWPPPPSAADPAVLVPDLWVDEQQRGEVEENHRDRGVSPPSFHPPDTRRILSTSSRLHHCCLNPFHRKMTFVSVWWHKYFLDLVNSSYFTLFTPEYWKCGALWTRAASDHDEQIPASQPIISRGRHETLTPCPAHSSAHIGMDNLETAVHLLQPSAQTTVYLLC